MEMKNIPFGTTNWSEIIPAEYQGETGIAIWRTASSKSDNIGFELIKQFQSDFWEVSKGRRGQTSCMIMAGE